jgi:hypothetical protein
MTKLSYRDMCDLAAFHALQEREMLIQYATLRQGLP